MKIIEKEITKENLDTYQKVSIAFEGNSVFKFEPIDSGLAGFKVFEEDCKPFYKDYDNYEKLSDLMIKFDLRNWKLLTIEDQGKVIGGALLAFDTKGIHMLCDRSDLLVVWDIRINPEYRGKKLGTKLFNQIKEVARTLKATEINIETQNNNTKACKFYASQGAEIKSFKKEAYNDLIDEIQIIFSIKLEDAYEGL